jgi:hypothetical protein
MDPNALLRRLLDALADDDRAEVMASLSDLHNWIERGGMLPDASAVGPWVATHNFLRDARGRRTHLAHGVGVGEARRRRAVYGKKVKE